MCALSREQVRLLDRLAAEEYGIPSIVLMENAGRSVADIILECLRKEGRATDTTTAAIFCGSGNNGGDGYVIARHLHNAGLKVAVYSAADPAKLSGDAATQRTIVEKMRLPLYSLMNDDDLTALQPQLERSQILVDALLGTGFSGELRPHLASIIRCCNDLAINGRKMFAVDVPSGLDCNSGQPSNATIRADVTVTFVAAKQGFNHPDARPCLGRVVVATIGTPPELLERVGSTENTFGAKPQPKARYEEVKPQMNTDKHRFCY
ncbi:MAG: NAD(P)H-hydrate epimerase [Planctomycetota bacterium]